jgi:hypothetical protein
MSRFQLKNYKNCWLLNVESALLFPHESLLPRLTFHPPSFPFPKGFYFVLILETKSPVFVFMLVVFMHDKFSLNKEIRITFFFALRDFLSTESILGWKEKKNSPAINYFHVHLVVVREALELKNSSYICIDMYF